MKRRSITLAVAAVAIASIAWPAAALSSPRQAKQARLQAANSQTYTDAAGDSGNAPDVTTVAVSNDDNGQITFAITLANRPSLTGSDFVGLAMDTNGNLSDGVGGIDYIAGVTSSGGALLSGAGGTLNLATAASFSSSFANGVVTVSVNKSDIGNPTQINFGITTTGDQAATFPENAPDSGLWSYQVIVTPPTKGPTGPTGPTGPSPVVLAATAPHLSKAVAGKPFTASMVVTDSSTGQGVKGTVACSASVGGSALKATRHTSTASGTATCAWKLPKTAHGKQLKGKITVTYKGKKISKPFSTKVK